MSGCKLDVTMSCVALFATKEFWLKYLIALFFLEVAPMEKIEKRKNKREKVKKERVEEELEMAM